jgi:hypothetical protein
MTNVTKIAFAALALTVAGTSVAFAAVAGPPSRLGGGNSSHPDYSVECRVHGDSFYVMNWGNSVLDSGLQIAWASPTTDDSGVILLPKMLAPGEEVQLADVLSGIVVPGATCQIAIV